MNAEKRRDAENAEFRKGENFCVLCVFIMSNWQINK
jgi:hypothetical protein